VTGPLTFRQWRGLVALSQDAVLEASRAVERIHLHTARRTFGVLERIPVVAVPAGVVSRVHDLTVTSVYGIIRLTTSAVGSSLLAGFDGVERMNATPRQPEQECPHEGGRREPREG